MRRGDRLMLCAFIALLVICVVVWGTRYARTDSVLTATISQDGRVIMSVDLGDRKDCDLAIPDKNGGGNTIRISDGTIAVISADCPDKDCVRRGAIKRAGESIVCLPHRLVIRVIGSSEENMNVDGATY